MWDFDLTILRTHAFGEGVEVAEVAQRWESDVRDVDVFRAFVETAQEQGVALGIASYGRQEVIHEYMRQIFRQVWSGAVPTAALLHSRRLHRHLHCLLQLSLATITAMAAAATAAAADPASFPRLALRAAPPSWTPIPCNRPVTCNHES